MYPKNPTGEPKLPSRKALFCSKLPTEPGTYRWSACSFAVPGLRLSWVDETREWAGVHLPDFIQPSYFTNPRDLTILEEMKLAWEPSDEDTTLCVVGHPVRHACPYCGSMPVLHGVRRTPKHVIVGAAPYTYSSFWLKCCEWGDTPHVEDPRTLIARRAQVLDLPMNLASMAKRLTRNHPDEKLRSESVAYLKRNNLFNPLR